MDMVFLKHYLKECSVFTNSACCFSVDSGMNGFFSRMLFCGVFLFVSPAHFLFRSFIVYRVYKVFCTTTTMELKDLSRSCLVLTTSGKKVFTGISKVEVQSSRRLIARKMGCGLSSRIGYPLLTDEQLKEAAFSRGSSISFVLC